MPKIDLPTLEKEIVDLLNREVGSVEKGIATEIERIYNNIELRSPRISFYYVANHVIEIRTST
ncbi:hypothetical protein LCGC14_2536430, partial [marine sediment metagenome]